MSNYNKKYDNLKRRNIRERTSSAVLSMGLAALDPTFDSRIFAMSENGQRALNYFHKLL